MTHRLSLSDRIGRHPAIFTAPPQRIPSTNSVDAPLLGNGDVTVAVGGDPAHLRFHLSKNDLWRLQQGNGQSCPVPFGHLRLSCPDLQQAGYALRQDLYAARTEAEFTAVECGLRMACWVAATTNLLVIELLVTGRPLTIDIGLDVMHGRGSESQSGTTDGVSWATRAFRSGVDVASGAAVAWTVCGAEPRLAEGIVCDPQRPVTVVLAMHSLIRSEAFLADAIAQVAAARSPARLADLRAAHALWWQDYWQRSEIAIDDPPLEGQYYRSLYGMACCSRDPRFPPPIFGWTTSDRPDWQGDYHLNYNHQAPFYGLAQANRLEQADPHDAPLIDFLERGRWHCQAIFGHPGVVYPVGIGPLGIETTYGIELDDINGVKRVEHGCFLLGQRSNATYGAVNMAARWYSTFDHGYGRRILPYIREVATFWEHHLRWDAAGQRYVIDNDSCHESSGPDFNPCVSLALVRTVFELAISLCRSLDQELERCPRWQHLLDHLSGFSTQERAGLTVFRYCEAGTAWRDDNTIGIQHIYPAGQVHLDSDPQLLAVARNTIAVMGRWQDSNGANSFFPAAVRVGCDPQLILEQLRRYAEDTWPNGFRAGNPHAIENWSTVPNTLHEMLCMSHRGIIRVFAVWPRERDAWFARLRCWGAFLVSSELRGGTVSFVEVLSEQGHDCVIDNPWPAAAVQLCRDGGAPQILSGQRLRIATAPGEHLRLTAAPS